MTDHDVRDLFERVLETTEPPMPGADATVADGRRSRRRRLAATITGTAAAVVALAVGGALVVPGLAGRDQNPAPGRIPAAHQSTHRTAPPPSPEIARHRADRLLAGLVTEVPPGYTTPPDQVLVEGAMSYQVQGVQVLDADRMPIIGDAVTADFINASTDVYRGTGAGSLSVTARHEKGSPPSDLCAATVEHQGTEAGCKVTTTANGARVRVAWRSLDQYGEIWYATRYYDGFSVTLQESQNGMRPNSTQLAHPLYTGDQLAAHVAVPGLAIDPS